MEKQTEKQLPFPVYNDNWRWFKLIDLFDIQGTKKQLPTDETKSGPYPHVSSKATNNGVMEHYDYFTEKGISVGTTTIYRNLEKMVEEGIVAKYTVDGTSSACFEYLGDEEHVHAGACYHCKCEKCGKLIHLQCDEVENLRKHMMEHHSFEMNPVRTVFYGICSDCRK